MGRFGHLALLTALAVTLAACASRGPVDNAVVRSLTWFNYAAGTDIKAACGPGFP